MALLLERTCSAYAIRIKDRWRRPSIYSSTLRMAANPYARQIWHCSMVSVVVAVQCGSFCTLFRPAVRAAVSRWQGCQAFDYQQTQLPSAVHTTPCRIRSRASLFDTSSLISRASLVSCGRCGRQRHFALGQRVLVVVNPKHLLVAWISNQHLAAEPLAPGNLLMLAGLAPSDHRFAFHLFDILAVDSPALLPSP